MYVLDTSSFRVLEGYYPQTFATFWNHFNRLVEDGRLVSVAEVLRELEQRIARQHVLDWLDAHRPIFTAPSASEMTFVATIFAVPHFRQLVGAKQLARGDPVADPWVIARAHAIGGVVVTEEALKPNAARIPNVCEHFGIDCTNLEGMLAREGWQY